MNDITSTITKPLAVLGENGSGYGGYDVLLPVPGWGVCGGSEG